MKNKEFQAERDRAEPKLVWIGCWLRKITSSRKWATLMNA